LIERQRLDLARIEDCAQQVSNDLVARALAERAIGAAKAHLDSLLELQQQRRPAGSSS
jgi:endonuclease/exonuclease/phosphatase family metal-dependent hydrolase